MMVVPIRTSPSTQSIKIGQHLAIDVRQIFCQLSNDFVCYVFIYLSLVLRIFFIYFYVRQSTGAALCVAASITLAKVNEGIVTISKWLSLKQPLNLDLILC